MPTQGERTAEVCKFAAGHVRSPLQCGCSKCCPALARAERLAEEAQARTPKLDPQKRAGYERMADICVEFNLWQAGLGPKPPDLIVCHDHGRPK